MKEEAYDGRIICSNCSRLNHFRIQKKMTKEQFLLEVEPNCQHCGCTLKQKEIRA